MIYDKVANAFSSLDEVMGVCLAGSSTGLFQDEFSDYDIYVYSSSFINREKRKEILDKFGETKIGLSFFEEGDELIIPKERKIDIMYRHLDWIKNQIEDVWIKHNARLGYSTCFIYNLFTSRILYEKDSYISNLKKKIDTPYPETLRNRIIEDNLLIMDGEISFPFKEQIFLASKRNDLVSLNHRICALMASYFDVVFAYNRVLHPGEKRLMPIIKALKLTLPENAEHDIKEVYLNAASPSTIVDKVDILLKNLRKMVYKK